MLRERKVLMVQLISQILSTHFQICHNIYIWLTEAWKPPTNICRHYIIKIQIVNLHLGKQFSNTRNVENMTKKSAEINNQLIGSYHVSHILNYNKKCKRLEGKNFPPFLSVPVILASTVGTDISAWHLVVDERDPSICAIKERFLNYCSLMYPAKMKIIPI